jgi:Tfp pilus assembly protein PilN
MTRPDARRFIEAYFTRFASVRRYIDQTREAARRDGESWHDLLLAELELAATRIRLGPEDSIEELVLTGEHAAEVHGDLRERMADSSLIGPQLRFEMAPEQERRLDEAAASLGLAYAGIARRVALELNLLPAELRAEQSRSAYVPSIVLAVVILGLIGGFAFRPTIQEQIMMRRLDDELRSLQGPVGRVRSLKTQTEALEKRIRYVEDTLRPCDMNLEILQELSTLMPADTFLNLYRNADKTITLTGSSGRAEELIRKLEESPLLKNVQQRGTVFKDAQTGKDRFNFEAKLERCQ